MGWLVFVRPILTCAPKFVCNCSAPTAAGRTACQEFLHLEAVAAGVGGSVEEAPRIISYREAVSRAVAADGLLVLGVEDPAYMPSKLLLYAMTGKPLLACMHYNSQVNDYFKRFPELGTLIHFDGPSGQEAAEDALLLEFLTQVIQRRTFLRRKHPAGVFCRRDGPATCRAFPKVHHGKWPTF